MSKKKEFTITLDVAVKAVDKDTAVDRLSVMLSKRGFKFWLGEVKEETPKKEPEKPKETKKEEKTETKVKVAKSETSSKPIEFEGKYNSK